MAAEVPVRAWKVLSLVWAALMVVLLAHQVHLWWRGGLVVDADVLALLPREERDDVAHQALQRLSERAARRVVVLVGAPTLEAAGAAADALLGALGDQVTVVDEAQSLDALVGALRPFRDGLLSRADAAFLSRATPEQLSTRALALLQQPVARRVGAWRDDPLQLFGAFLEERAQATRVRPRDGRLVVDDGATQFVLVQVDSKAPAFSFDGTRRLEPVLEKAMAQARAAGATEVLAAGVPRFAETAAARASQEVSTVGLGSMLAILVVMWLAFRSFRPLVLVTVTVALGVAAGLSACMLVFGSVHVVTLVFGASLVGVAEDYGIHYFASRQAAPSTDKLELLWHHLPGLSLALLTSIAGYAMLAVAPFPGLRQVALFSGVGLAVAFVGAMAFFPFLDGREVKQTRFAQRWAASRQWWPVVRGRRAVVVTGVVLLLSAVGFARLRVEDDVRELSSAPAALLDEQVRVARLMGLSSPAQVFIVRGSNEAEVLEREEQLTAQLQQLVERSVLTGFDAVSAWVPSPARQRHQREWSQSSRTTIETALADELEEGAPPADDAWRPLAVADLLATPLGAQLSALWVPETGAGPASLVSLKGLSRAGLPALAALDAPAQGVRFVDRTGTLSALLGRTRASMSWLLLAGYALVYAALWLRFRARAWRALAPTVVGSVLAVASVGLLGEQLELFHVLALWLLLGMGVDYGIFLLEHPSRQAGEAWLAVGLGAVSTLLSFGLLALSTTPAIHAFGLAMAVGIGSVWALSPLFCDDAPRSAT